MTEYILRASTDDDFMLAYDIRKNALGEYIKQTWGWDEDWQMKFHKEDFNKDILSIIEVKGEPAGTLEVFYEPEHMVISGIYIIDKFQNLGIGTDLLKDLIRLADEKKLNIRLQVLKVNPKAKQLYERLGFDTYNTTDTHYQMIYKLKKSI